MKKNEEQKKEEKRFSTKEEENLPDDIYTKVSKIMMNALIFGIFDDFENMLDDKVETVLYGLKTIYGKADVLAYWWDWRARFVMTKKVTNFEVLMSHYYSHACIKMEAFQLIMFQIEDGKIAKILLLPAFLTSPYSDDNMLNYPYDFKRVKPYLKPVEKPYDENGDEVDVTNHIPCLSCGTQAADLRWYIVEHPKWNNWKGAGLVSVCPQCGRVVEFKEGKTEHVQGAEEMLFPIVESNYSDQGNAFSEYAEKLYSKERIGLLREVSYKNFYRVGAHPSATAFADYLTTVLTDVKVEDGYRIDVTLPSPGDYDIGDITHVRVVDKDGKAADKITDHLLIKPTEMGVWQLYLLENIHTVLPVYWHGGYEKRTYIFKETDIDGITPLKYHDLSDLLKRNLLLPSVEVSANNDKTCMMAVCCCYWNDWAGLVREKVSYTIEDGRLTNKETTRTVLFQHDCGIMF